MRQKTLLIIGAGEMQVPIIKKAKSLNIRTIVTDISENAPGSVYADIFKVADTHDQDINLKIATDYSIDGVLTTSDYPVNTVSCICERLNLPGPSISAAQLCTDKFLQREILKKSAIHVPDFKLVNVNDVGNLDLSLFSFPLIVKPVDSSASRGVTKVFSRWELNSSLDIAFKYSKIGKVIIENFIDGEEYSIECIVKDGITNIIAITEKTTDGESDICFVETRHIVPAYLSLDLVEKITAYVRVVIKIIGLDNSASHVEIKIENGRPVLIEIAARLGGDFITSDLVPLATGIDMQENVIKLALGEMLNLTPSHQKFAGIQFINAENYKDVVHYLNHRHEHLIKHKVENFGNKRLTNSLDRLGYFIVCKDTRSELLAVLNLEYEN
ncbi:MAG: ATP-grasp domain-containing protein [Sphingobacteriaceae bacterium]